jgi:hypothetical protein
MTRSSNRDQIRWTNNRGPVTDPMPPSLTDRFRDAVRLVDATSRFIPGPLTCPNGGAAEALRCWTRVVTTIRRDL